MKYLLTNTTLYSVVIDGLGVLEPGQNREFTSSDAEGFRNVRGVGLLSTNVPEGIEVTVVTEEGDK